MKPKKDQPLMPQSYTAEMLTKMRKEWTMDAYAMALDARMRQIERNHKLTFIETGLILNEVESLELWKRIPGKPFRSFDSWLSDAAPVSRATGYDALKAVKELQDVPVEELNEMPRCNVKLLTKVPKKDRARPEIREAAKKQDEQSFRKTIEVKVPNAHIEAKAPMRFKPEKSQRKTIDAAIEAAMLLEECTTREEAMEAIAEHYLLSHQSELESKAQTAYV